MATWVDLLDPTSDELHDALPQHIHESALELLSAPPKHEDEPRPRLEGQGEYVFGIVLVAVAVPESDRTYSQDLALALTKEAAVPDRTPPEQGEPFRIDRCRHVVR